MSTEEEDVLSGYVATFSAPEGGHMIAGPFEDPDAAREWLIALHERVPPITEESEILGIHQPVFILEMANRARERYEREFPEDEED